MTPDPIRAKNFAAVAHAGQTYEDEMPYDFHLQKVVDTLAQFGIRDPVPVSAGYLHDTLEDTRKSYRDIKDRFGEEVAELVYAVTNELGRNRKERAIRTYPKIKGTPGALVLKLADRIANVHHGLITGGKTEMYQAEFEDFVVGLYRPSSKSTSGLKTTEDIEQRMWAYLARLLNKDAEFQRLKGLLTQ